MPRGVYKGQHGPLRKQIKGCSGCSRALPRSAFYQRHNGQVVSRCIECCLVAGRGRSRNPIAKARYRAKNLDKNLAYGRAYHAKPENKARRNAALRERTSRDPAFAITRALRRTLADKIRAALAGKAANTLTLLGCPIDRFLEHIQDQWRSGMSWENWGRGRGRWHLDHKLPIASFDLTDEEAQRVCFHWSNFQPLWSDENIRKGARVDGACGV